MKFYYHIACIHPALSVSSVAGSVFMDGTCHGSVGSMCIRRRKGFLYEWPLAKTVVKLLVDSFVERITFRFTDIFSLCEMCVDYNFLQISIPYNKV